MSQTNGAAREWYADEDFWESFYDAMFPAARFEAAAEQIAQTLALAGVSGGAALDLCCGPGRHAVALARAGFDVTGVDKSPYLLGKAREYAAGRGGAVAFLEGDMRDFSRPGAFDLVVNMFTSFGYFETPGEDAAVLRRIFDNLKPGGAFVIDVIGKEALARVYQPSRAERLPDGAMWVQRSAIKNDWTRIQSEWTMLRDGTISEFSFEHSIYDAAGLGAMLREAGFADIKFYGHLSGTPYDETAQRLIACARRPR